MKFKNSIRVSTIKTEVKKIEAISISNVGITNIINSQQFWLEFPVFFLRFIKNNPNIQDKRVKKIDKQSKNSQD